MSNIDFSKVTDVKLNRKVVTKITNSAGKVLWEKKVTPTEPDYIWFKNETTSYANFIIGDDMKSPINLEYSLNKVTWNNYDMSNKPKLVIDAGSYVYLRGVNTGVTFEQHYLHFDFTLDQPFSTGGDIRTLFNYQDVTSVTKIPDNAFVDCFEPKTIPTQITSCTWDMSGITEVGQQGFYYCFYKCPELTTAPDFSNVTSAGNRAFSHCFETCTSLTTPPNFSNLTSVPYYGFDYCFDTCTSLTTAPNFSNLTTVGENAFNYCYVGCTKLTTAPDFSNVTTVGESGFNYCFSGCKSLNLVTAPNITTWSTYNFNGWLNNVASTGVVRKPAKLTIPTGTTSGVPTGWTTENY